MIHDKLLGDKFRVVVEVTAAEKGVAKVVIRDPAGNVATRWTAEEATLEDEIADALVDARNKWRIATARDRAVVRVLRGLV